MRWLVVGLAILGLIGFGIVVWIINRFQRTGAESVIVLLLVAAVAGVVLAASDWTGWRLVQGLVAAVLVFLGVAFLILVLGSGLPGY